MLVPAGARVDYNRGVEAATRSAEWAWTTHPPPRFSGISLHLAK
jgi:hypothetical protein